MDTQRRFRPTDTLRFPEQCEMAWIIIYKYIQFQTCMTRHCQFQIQWLHHNPVNPRHVHSKCPFAMLAPEHTPLHACTGVPGTPKGEAAEIAGFVFAGSSLRLVSTSCSSYEAFQKIGCKFHALLRLSRIVFCFYLIPNEIGNVSPKSWDVKSFSVFLPGAKPSKERVETRREGRITGNCGAGTEATGWC